MTFNEKFVITKGYKNWSFALMGIGLIAVILLFITHGLKSDDHEQARFWGSLLQNSVYFLLVTNAAMFFICATTLAWGGWQLSFRRVTEAISSCVPVIGVITVIILLVLVFGPNHVIYHWADPQVAEHDKIIHHKSGFLNKGFFTVWTLITVVGWTVLGRKMRQLSRATDNNPMSIEEGKRYMWKNTVWASLYIVLFALTVMSSIPWLSLMSIDAHWYSTMYSWYTFASTFVAGIALITLFVIYLKNRDQLEYVTEEHLHDLGKFMFAFSIFWTYLWFSQYMLIWYSNQPEETKYFIDRLGTAKQGGPFKGIFFFNLIVNFIFPLLVLMMKGAKRNWTLMTFMAVLIIFGHWIDFYQMVMPGTLGHHAELNLFEFGIAALFIGIIMWGTGRYLSSHSLVIKNHPFLKESMIHHT